MSDLREALYEHQRGLLALYRMLYQLYIHDATPKRVDIQAARAILDECGVDYGDNDR